MRTAHFSAFDAMLKSAVPALAQHTYDGDVPTNPDGTIRREAYLVEHDMGFDGQDDGRLTAEAADDADGTYRVTVRVVAKSRATVRANADDVKAAMTGRRLDISGRSCGAISKDSGPDAIERDTSIVGGPLFWTDLDFIWRSSRA